MCPRQLEHCIGPFASMLKRVASSIMQSMAATSGRYIGLVSVLLHKAQTTSSTSLNLLKAAQTNLTGSSVVLWALGILACLAVLWAAGGASLKRGLPALAEMDVSADELDMGTCRPARERVMSLDLLRLKAVLHLVLQLSVQRNWLLPVLTAQVTTTTPAPSILELPGFARTNRGREQQSMAPVADEASALQHRRNRAGALQALSPGGSDVGSWESFRDA